MPWLFDSGSPKLNCASARASLRTRASAPSHVAFRVLDRVGTLHRLISELNHRAYLCPCQRFKCSLTAALA
jgi:hypothetical protein